MASEQMYTFSSRPTTPREKTPDITVKFQAINRSNGTIVAHFFSLNSNCKLAVVRRKISHAFRDLYEKGFVFMCKNKEVVRTRESEFTLFDILPKVPLGRPSENFRFQDVPYRRISVDVEGRRHVITCACVVFVYEGSGISHWQRDILLQALCEGTNRGYGFIPCDVTSCMERLPDVHIALVFEYAADKRKSVQDLAEELDKLPGDINLESLRDHRKRNPLHYAAESEGVTPQKTLQKCEKLVMKLGRDQVYHVDKCGKTPLHCALYRRRLTTVAYLLQLDPDIIKILDIYSNTSFDLINEMSINDTRKLMNFVNADCLDEMLVFYFACYAIRMKYKKLSKKFTPVLKNVGYALELGRTALHLAGELGDKEILENVLKVKDNTLIKDTNGYLPFHCACKFGQEQIIGLLFPESMKDDEVCFGIRLALRSNHVHVIKEITKIKPILKMDALTLACITEILNDDFNTNAPKIFPLSDTDTILASRFIHHAAYMNQADIIKTLMTIGADPNLVDMMGRTPLHEASQRNNLEVVSCLLESGADPNITDWRHSSPLHYACAAGHLDIVKILLGVAQIDPKLRDACGRSPLLLAGYYNRGTTADYLIQEHCAMIDFNICDVHGFTTLHYASCLSPSSVDILLASGVAWKNAMMPGSSSNPAKHWNSMHHLWQVTDVYEAGKEYALLPNTSPIPAERSYSIYHAFCLTDNYGTEKAKDTTVDKILKEDKDAFTKEMDYPRRSAKSNAYVKSKQSISACRKDFSTGESPLEVALKKRCNWLALKLCRDVEGYLSDRDYGVWSSLITAIDTFSPSAVDAILASNPVGLESTSLLYRSLSLIQWENADIDTTYQEHIVRSLLALRPDINGRCCSRHIDNMYEIRRDFSRNADICIRCLKECHNFENMTPKERKSLYKEGLTLLEMASWANSDSLIELLLDNGAIPGCDFAVHNALHHGNVNMTRRLLKRMQSINTDNLSKYAEYMKKKLSSKNRSILVAACLSRNASLDLLEVVNDLCPLAFKSQEAITGHYIKAITPVYSRYTLPYLRRLQTDYIFPLLAIIESGKQNSKTLKNDDQRLTNISRFLLDHGDFLGKMQINKTTSVHGACVALKSASNANLGDVVNALITHEWNLIVRCKLANDPSTCCGGDKRSISHMLLCNKSREPLPTSVIQNIVRLSQDFNKPSCAKDVYLIMAIVFPMWEFHFLDCETYGQKVSIIQKNAGLNVIPGRSFWLNSVELLNVLRRIAAITFNEKDRFWELFRSLDSAEETLKQAKLDSGIDMSASYRDIGRLFRKMVGMNKMFMDRDGKSTSIVRDVIHMSGNVVQICEKFMERETAFESREDFITAVNNHIEDDKSPGRKFWESSKTMLNTLGVIAENYYGDAEQYRSMFKRSAYGVDCPISARDKLRAIYVKMLRRLWRHLKAAFIDERLLDSIPTAYLPAHAMNAISVLHVAPMFSNIFPVKCGTSPPSSQTRVTPEQMNFEQFMKHACQSGSIDHLLSLACSFGNKSVVRQIVQSECPPHLDFRSDVCEAPLDLAVTHCFPDIVRILLNAGAVCKESHLISACQSVNFISTTKQVNQNRKKIMKLLCNHSSVDQTSINKALVHAASSKQWALVDTIFENGGKIDTKIFLDSKSYRDEESKAALAKRHSRKTITELVRADPLKRKAMPDGHQQRDGKSDTSIYLVEEEKAAFAKKQLWLLVDGYIKHCCQASIWKILENAENLSDDAYFAMIHSISRHLHEDVAVKAFAMLSTDTRFVTTICAKHHGETIFHITASRGHSSLLRWLIYIVKDSDSTMTMCLASGTGPLWTALANKHWETAKLLICFGSSYRPGGRSIPGLLPKRVYHLPRSNWLGKRPDEDQDKNAPYGIKKAKLTDAIPDELMTLIHLHHFACTLQCSILQAAAASGSLDLVKEMLAVNPDLALKKDEQGRSIGFYAAYNGHVNILQYVQTELHQVDMDCVVALLGGILEERGLSVSIAESVAKHLKKQLRTELLDDLKAVLSKMGNWGRSNTAVKRILTEKTQLNYKTFLSCLKTMMNIYGNDNNRDLILLIISIIDNPIIVKSVLHASDFSSGSLMFSRTFSIVDVMVPLVRSTSNRREVILFKKKTVASCLHNQSVSVHSATIKSARLSHLWDILEEIAKWEKRQDTTSEQTLDEWKTSALSASFSGNSKVTSIIFEILSVKCEQKTFQLLLVEALQNASFKGSRATVDMLLDFGGSIELTLNEPVHDFIKQSRRYFVMDWTSLHSAATKGRSDLMKFYLQRVKDSTGEVKEEILQQLLFLSASNGRLETVKLLKAHFRNDDWVQTISRTNICSIYPDDNVIIAASRRGQEEVCLFLIGQLSVSEIVGSIADECHLLHFAAKWGMSRLCNTIMKIATDSKNAKDNRNMLPLEYAVAMGRTDVVLLLCDRYSSLQEGQLLQNYPGWFRYALNHNDNIKASTSFIRRVLVNSRAASFNNSVKRGDDNAAHSMLLAGKPQFLHEIMTSPQVIGEYLGEISQNGCAQALQTLLQFITQDCAKSPSDFLQRENSHGYPPVCMSVLNKHVKTLNILLNAEKPTSWKHRRTGENILHLAVRGGDVTIIKKVTEAVGFILKNAVDASGLTPICVAAALGLAEILRMMMRGEQLKTAPEHNDHMRNGACEYTCLHCLLDKAIGWSKTYQSGRHEFELLRDIFKDLVIGPSERVKLLFGWYMLCKEPSILSAGLMSMGFQGVSDSCVEYLLLMKMNVRTAIIKDFEAAAISLWEMSSSLGENVDNSIISYAASMNAKKFLEHVLTNNPGRLTGFDSYIKETVIETSLGFGYFQTGWYMAQRYSNESMDKTCKNFMEMSEVLPVKIAWIIGAAKLGDESWRKSLFIDEGRLSIPDVWLTTCYPDDLKSTILDRCGDMSLPTHLLPYDTTLSYDESSFRLIKQLSHQSDTWIRSMISSNIVLGRHKENMNKYQDAENEITEIRIICLPDTTTEAPSMTISKGILVDKVRVEMKDDQLLLLHDESFNESHEIRTWKKEIQTTIEYTEHAIATLYGGKIGLKVDWRSIDENSASKVRQIYRECAESGLCGLVDNLHLLLIDIELLFDSSKVCQTNLSEITVRYVDSLPEVSVETSFGSLLVQKTATWAFSIREGKVIYDRLSLPIWNIRCILRQASMALTSVSSTWNVKFDIELKTFENIPYRSLLKLFATDIRFDLEYIAACYRSMLRIKFAPARLVLKAAIARSQAGIEMIGSTINVSVALYQNTAGVWCSELDGVEGYLDAFEENQQRTCYAEFEYMDMIEQSKAKVKESVGIDMPISIERDQVLSTISRLSHRTMSDLLSLGKYVLKRFVDDVSVDISQRIQDFGHRFCFKVGKLIGLQNGLWCVTTAADIQNGKQFEELLVLVSDKGVPYFEVQSKTSVQVLNQDTIVGVWHKHPNSHNGVPEKLSATDVPHLWVHQDDIYIITNRSNVQRLSDILWKTYSLDNRAVTEYLEKPISNLHSLPTAADRKAIGLSDVFIGLEQPLVSLQTKMLPSPTRFPLTAKLPYNVHFDRHSLAAFASKHKLKPMRYIEDLGYSLEKTLDRVKEHLDSELYICPSSKMPGSDRRNILKGFLSLRVVHIPEFDKTRRYPEGVDIALLSPRDILINVVGVPVLDGERYTIPTFIATLEKTIYDAVVAQCEIQLCKDIRNFAKSAVTMNIVRFKNGKFNQNSFPNDVFGMKLFTDRLGSVISYVLSTRPIIKSIMLYEMSSVNVSLNGKSLCVSRDDDAFHLIVPFLNGKHCLVSNSEIIEGILGCFDGISLESLSENRLQFKTRDPNYYFRTENQNSIVFSVTDGSGQNSCDKLLRQHIKENKLRIVCDGDGILPSTVSKVGFADYNIEWVPRKKSIDDLRSGTPEWTYNISMSLNGQNVLPPTARDVKPKYKYNPELQGEVLCLYKSGDVAAKDSDQTILTFTTSHPEGRQCSHLHSLNSTVSLSIKPPHKLCENTYTVNTYPRYNPFHEMKSNGLFHQLTFKFLGTYSVQASCTVCCCPLDIITPECFVDAGKPFIIKVLKRQK